jgi:Ca2+-binding EF-hand superfamily protein
MDSPRGKRAVSSPPQQTGRFVVDKKELEQAFSFFDTKKKGHITMDDLKARLPIFYNDMPARELKFLMNNKSQLHFNDLFELLQDNTLSNFDPAVEAFKVGNPTRS